MPKSKGRNTRRRGVTVGEARALDAARIEHNQQLRIEHALGLSEGRRLERELLERARDSELLMLFNELVRKAEKVLGPAGVLTGGIFTTSTPTPYVDHVDVPVRLLQDLLKVLQRRGVYAALWRDTPGPDTPATTLLDGKTLPPVWPNAKV